MASQSQRSAKVARFGAGFKLIQSKRNNARDKRRKVMGCDIHLYKEAMVNGKWVSLDEWIDRDDYEGGTYKSIPYEKRFTERNYELFGFLSCGVRSKHEFSFQPRGMPISASDEVMQEFDCWGSDGHSHSYLYLHEIKDAIKALESKKIKISGMKDADEIKQMAASFSSDNPDYQLIFPYCRYTNSPNYRHFEVEVPVDFYFGDSLRRIVSMFDGAEGEHKRIVFWFDN